MAGARVGDLMTLSLTGRVAAQNMLAQEAEISTVPYLWTAMFGKSLRYAGNRWPGQGRGQVRLGVWLRCVRSAEVELGS